MKKASASTLFTAKNVELLGLYPILNLGQVGIPKTLKIPPCPSNLIVNFGPNYTIFFNMIRIADETEQFARFISSKQAPNYDVTPSMLHEQNVNNPRYILLVNGPSQYAYFDDARMSILKAVMLDPRKILSFSISKE